VPLFIDAVKYFIDNAGEDNKLSWEEVQKAPLMVKFGPEVDCPMCCDGLQDLQIPFVITEFHFDQAQNIDYDWDSSRLNFREFSIMLYGFDDLFTCSTYGCSTPEWVDRRFPHCDEDSIETETPEKEKEVRAAIRNGIASAIEDSWPLKKMEIDHAIKEGKLSEVVGLLYEYLPVVAKTTHRYNPEIRKYCYIGCVDELYEIEEMASKKALKNKTIRGFWDDVAGIFSLVLEEAKKRGIDVRDVFNAKWNEENVSYDDMVDPRYDEYQLSNFTLMSLMEKANPEVTKKIAAAVKKSKSKS